MGGSRETTHTNQTQTTRLPEFQQGAVNTYFSELMRQFNETGLQRTPYQGDLVADLTPEQLEAQTMARTFAEGRGTDYSNRALDTSAFLLDPQNLLDPSRIPGFDASEEAITRQLTRNLTENILPQSRTGAILAGGYGGTARGKQEALATGRTSEAIADSLAANRMQTYFAGLNAMQNALNMAPQTASLGLLPAQIIEGIGAQNQEQQQRETDAEVRRHEATESAPLEALALLQSLIGTAGQYGGTTTMRGTNTRSRDPGALETISALGALALAPSTFGTSLLGAGGGTGGRTGTFAPAVSPSHAAVAPSLAPISVTRPQLLPPASYVSPYL